MHPSNTQPYVGMYYPSYLSYSHQYGNFTGQGQESSLIDNNQE